MRRIQQAGRCFHINSKMIASRTLPQPTMFYITAPQMMNTRAAIFTKRMFHHSAHIQQEEKDPGMKQKSREAFTNPYIKSLRKFFLKVHPDFFVDQPKYQQCNQSSFQDLNELLNWISEYTEYASLPPDTQASKVLQLHPVQSKEFVFYCKGEKAQTKIEAKFKVPEKWAMDGSKRSARQVSTAVDNCLLFLLEQAGIAKPDISREGWVLNEEDARTHQNPRVNANYLREELRMALINNTQGKPIDKIKNGWWEDDIPSVDSLIDGRMLYLSRDITVQDSQQALDTLRRNIHRMEFYKWSNVPIMLGPEGHYGVNEPAPGFITIPFNFDYRSFNTFIDRNIDQVTTQGKNTKDRAKQIQNLRQAIEDELKLTKLSWNLQYQDFKGESKQVTLTSQQVLQCLESFYNGIDMIKEKYGPLLQGIHFTLGDKYQIINPEGVIMIKWDMVVNSKVNEMLGFLDHLGEKTIENSGKLATALKQLKEECKKMGNEIVDRLGCESLDVINHTKCSVAEKYSFLKRLQLQSLHLSKFDWSGYKFVLTDKNIQTGKPLKLITIKSDEKMAMFPENFTDDEMIKAIQVWSDEEKKKLTGEDDVDINPELIHNVEKISSLLEMQFNDPDFNDYYGFDLVDDVKSTPDEADEKDDEKELNDPNEFEFVENMSPTAFRERQQKEVEKSRKEFAMYKREFLATKKEIQKLREKDIEEKRKEMEAKLKTISDPEEQVQLINKYQSYVKARQRSIEFRRADEEGKIDILVEAIYEDVVRIYEEREKKRREEEQQLKRYKQYLKQKARIHLNYNLQTETPLKTYKDLAKQITSEEEEKQQVTE